MEAKNVTQVLDKALPDQTTVDRAAQTVHDGIDKVAAKAGPAVEKIRAAATGAAEKVDEKVTALSELEREWVANGRAYVRENPLTALALGVLAGAVLAKLTSSR